jgi:hypothetical protein
LDLGKCSKGQPWLIAQRNACSLTSWLIAQRNTHSLTSDSQLGNYPNSAQLGPKRCFYWGVPNVPILQFFAQLQKLALQTTKP